MRAGLSYVRERRLAVELCCGSGQATLELTAAGYAVVAVDSSSTMLAGLPGRAGVGAILASVRRLPFADRSCPLLVGLNAVLIPDEARRVLRDDGQLLWCSSFGPGTPLYLDPPALLDQLGPGWSGQYGRASRGEWVLGERHAGVAEMPG